MKKKEIEKGIKEVIALESRYTSLEIQNTDPLDKFISSFEADRLARQLKRKFAKVKTTKLTNSLYSSVKTVNQLIMKINEFYNNS